MIGIRNLVRLKREMTDVATKFWEKVKELDAVDAEWWSSFADFLENEYEEFDFKNATELEERESKLIEFFDEALESPALKDVDVKTLWSEMLTSEMGIIKTIPEALQVMEYLGETDELEDSQVSGWVKLMKKEQFPDVPLQVLMHLPSSYDECYRIRYLQCWQRINRTSPFNGRSLDGIENEVGSDDEDVDQEVEAEFERARKRLEANGINLHEFGAAIDPNSWSKIMNDYHQEYGVQSDNDEGSCSGSDCSNTSSDEDEEESDQPAEPVTVTFEV